MSRTPFIVCLLFFFGCGSEAYERKFEESLERVRKASPFATLTPADLEDARVSLRLPAVFERGRRFKLDSVHPRDGGRIASNRLDMFLSLLPDKRDFKLCCEAETKDNGKGVMPFYCYVAAGPIQAEAAKTLAADIREQLMSQFPAKTSAEWKNIDWKTVDVPTPSGGTIRWRKLVVVGMQPFRRAILETSEAPRSMPGRFELYLYQTNGYYVLLGWRAHASFVDQVQLSQLAETTAGTLVVKP
jgi:hypothetical protein